MNVTFYEAQSYNAGCAISKTFDLTDYTNYYDFDEALNTWLARLNREEHIVADYEDVPAVFFDIFNFTFDSKGFYEWDSLNDDEQIAFSWLCANNRDLRYCLDNACNVTVIHCDIDEYVEELVDMMDLPEIARQYFDTDSYKRDCMLNGEFYEWENCVIIANC